MKIVISNSSDKPIYEQICMQVKNRIMNGTISAGEALPSMRAFAKNLHISVTTVQRTYEDFMRRMHFAVCMYRCLSALIPFQGQQVSFPAP